MPRRKSEVPVRAPRGSVVKLNGLTVSTAAHERIEALAAVMVAEGLARAHPSGALEMLILEPKRAAELLVR